MYYFYVSAATTDGASATITNYVAANIIIRFIIFAGARG